MLDISATAIEVTKKRLGATASDCIDWMCADITRVALPQHSYGVWHDRAVFHFLTSREQRAAYVKNVVSSIKAGGHVIIGAFGPNGPLKCSGLDVVRYDAESLHQELGPAFRLVKSLTQAHSTRFDTTQPFFYCYCRIG